jgi:RNA polymerase subunit RPABC4/transcription elongation factor Spt4
MKAKLEKLCLDNECQESWAKLPPESAAITADFVFCPYCSEELQLQCSACRESLTNKDFKFCPWCGAEFEN